MSDMPPPPPPNMAPPPGYIAYGGQGAAPRGVQNIGGLTKALVTLLVILLPLQLLSVVSTININSKARDFLNGSASESDFEKAAQFNIGQLAGLLIIPIAVLTIIWMFRMAGNLRSLGRTGATWAPGWAIGGWFVPPCVLYVVPWLMFKELWKGSDPGVAAGDPTWKSGRVSPLITVWWVLYGLVPLLGFVTSASIISQFSADNDFVSIAEQFDKYSAINIALAVVGIATTAVYLVLVRQLSARHMQATRES